MYISYSYVLSSVCATLLDWHLELNIRLAMALRVARQQGEAGSFRRVQWFVYVLVVVCECAAHWPTDLVLFSFHSLGSHFIFLFYFAPFVCMLVSFSVS